MKHKNKIKNKKILVSFVGTNDAGKLYGKKDGAILTVLENYRKFDEVYLIWTSSERPQINYDHISKYLEKEIKNRKLCHNVKRFYMDLYNVTDHNEIYPNLLQFLKNNLDEKSCDITAAIASGTPSMQACWILIAESGDFKLNLVRSNEPELGVELVTPVKLDTSLPKIIRLQEENKQLKSINRSLLPDVKLFIEKSELFIGDNRISLSPMQFCYYRYFLERKRNNESELKIKGIYLPKEFCERIISFYEESYKEYDINIREHKKKLSESEYIQSSSFRSTLSKLNKKIKEYLKNTKIQIYFLVIGTGPNQSKSYGINIPKEKIKILK